jgi:hypothetical protein
MKIFYILLKYYKYDLFAFNVQFTQNQRMPLK